ncbi:MAG TPA: ribosome small subunit-dependent GTPase A [Polyangiaceae bacterium]|nr:ribosome small subunit-dependent GTPase A [Polyangiaceae bacterium]
MSLSDVSPALEALGLSAFYRHQLGVLDAELGELAARWVVARIVCERRGEYELLSERGSLRASLAGRLEHELGEASRPCVGDWALVEPAEPVGRVQWVLERHSVLRRRSVDGSSRAQTLAANVDLCCVVCALTPEGSDLHTERRALNPRRIERYLRAAHDSRISALVLVNKADLASPEHAAARLDELGRALPGTKVELVSAHSEQGLSSLRSHLSDGCTAVVLGSSGVGKSTLVNRLLGRELQRTGQTREQDARGRHTTTERELLLLPGGGILIDTPGMRELSLWADADTDVSLSGYDDIDELAAGCRFRDCQHRGEPGCAVRAAIASGSLAAERLEHVHQLARELVHQQTRVDARVRSAERTRHKAIARAARARMKEKGRS